MLDCESLSEIVILKEFKDQIGYDLTITDEIRPFLGKTPNDLSEQDLKMLFEWTIPQEREVFLAMWLMSNGGGVQKTLKAYLDCSSWKEKREVAFHTLFYFLDSLVKESGNMEEKTKEKHRSMFEKVVKEISKIVNRDLRTDLLIHCLSDMIAKRGYMLRGVNSLLDDGVNLSKRLAGKRPLLFLLEASKSTSWTESECEEARKIFIRMFEMGSGSNDLIIRVNEKITDVSYWSPFKTLLPMMMEKEKLEKESPRIVAPKKRKKL